MKRVLLILLALALLLSLAACGGKSDDASDKKDGDKKSEPTPMELAAGTYEGIHAKFVGDENWADEDAFSLELKGDGTGQSNRDGESYKLTWTLEGETFTMKETFMGISLDYTGTLKDGELHIFNGDPDNDFTYEYYYKK